MVIQPGSALQSDCSCPTGVTGPEPLPADCPFSKLKTWEGAMLQPAPIVRVAQACGAPAVEQQQECRIDILGH